MQTSSLTRTSKTALDILSVSAISLTLWLAGCGGGADSGPVTTHWSGALYENGKLNSKLNGTWRAPGRGRLLEISAAGYRSYVEAGNVCYPDVNAASLLEDSVPAESKLQASVTGKSETVQILLLENLPARLTLQRIDTIPAACRLAPAADSTSVFQAFWQIFNSDYAFFKERGIDWDARFTQFAPKAILATTDSDLFGVMSETLQGLNDAHTNVMATTGEPLAFNAGGDSPTLRLFAQAFQAQTAISDQNAFADAYYQSLAQQVAAKLTGDSGAVLNGSMQWGRLSGNVGYIRITSLEGFASTAVPGNQTLANMRLMGEQMDHAVAQLADTRALILDVAHNSGGEAGVAWEIAGRFADKKRLAHTASFQRPQGLDTESWFIEPRGAQQYFKPVYLLTSDLTASAAERLTLMMRALPNVTHAGQSTKGIFSEVLPKSLPGGQFAVTLSSQRVLDPAGMLYENKGIPPSLSIPLVNVGQPETLWTGHASAIDQLLSKIAQTL